MWQEDSQQKALIVHVRQLRGLYEGLSEVTDRNSIPGCQQLKESPGTEPYCGHSEELCLLTGRRVY